jgi:glycosyltransferase involved in cell wall biosynthesis
MRYKKHILVTSSWFPSDRSTSDGVFVKEQAESLSRSGNQVTALIVTNARLGSWVRTLTSRKPRYDRSEFVTFIRKHVVFPLPSRFFSDPAATVKQYIIKRVCNRLNSYFAVHGYPDLVHHHCLSDNSYLAEAISKSFGIPYVFTEHSNYFTYAELNKFSWFETSQDHYRFVKNAAARITTAEIRARGYENIFAVPFICIPNLVTDLFAGPLTKRSPDLPFTFICVALLDRRKRQDILLKAFAKVFKGHNVRLMLVGSGILQDEYKTLSEALGLHAQVFFKGKQGRAEVCKLLDEAHVAILCSDQENNPNALLEAMFRGLAIVSTRSGGPEEIVTPEVGLLVSPGDEAALAEKMKQMYDNYASYDAEKIRASAMRRYSETVIVPQLERIYDQVCATPSAPVESQGSM